MKTLPKFLITLLIGLLFIYSCEEDSFTEEDAIKAIEEYEAEDVLLADSINNKGVELTIKVINATGDFSTKGQTGATVTVSVDGESLAVVTNAEGAATFTGLKPGIYAVNVTLENFTTVDFITEASSYGYYSVQVPILSTTTNLMTISGKVTLETDLLNTSREAAAGVTVIAKPNLPDYFGSIPGVREIAYSGYTNTAATDVNGSYTINVPADKAGELSYNISVPVFEEDQTLMLKELNGVNVTGTGNSAKTVATRFGTELSGTESAVPAVNPVYCVVGAPTHVLTPATLTVEINNDNSGVVDKAYVSVEGANYGPNDVRVTITNDNPDGANALVELHIENATGQVEWIEVISGGSKFLSVPTLDLKFIQTQCLVEVTI